ncbi:MAG: FKBP-type peptidyl-prolyl cis-trans isomerase [Bacteroidota bacterium]
MNLFRLICTVVLFGFLSSCEDDPFRVDYSSVPAPFVTEGTERVELPSGLVYYVVEEGVGSQEVVIRDRVLIYYTGRNSEGAIFDSSYENGNEIPRNNNVTDFNAGFTEGLIGMKTGEKRVFVIPPELGYGDVEGHSLQEETITFDVELVAILL